jgi:cyclophilin family peptidyl-prolyl cis-trans isomerase/HEAT repeat protein
VRYDRIVTQKSFHQWSLCAVVSALMIASACASAPKVPVVPPTPPVPEVPLDRRVAWVLRLEAQRLLRDPGIEPAVLTTPVTPAPARTADLIALVMDVSPAVRGRAALAIGRVGMAEGVAPLVATLADAEAPVRAQAAFALGLLGRLEAMAPLRAALADPDPAVRGRVAEGLGLIAAQAPAAEATPERGPAASAIADAFAGCAADIASIAPDDEMLSPTPAVESCRLAIFALARLRQFEPLARVVLNAEGRPVSEWWPVAYALQRVGDDKAIPALVHLSRSTGIYTAAFALRSVGGTPEGLALAQKIALDPAADARLRVAAIRALGRRGSTAGADRLMALLATRGLSSTLTLEAMTALTATGDARAVDVMIDRLTDERPQIRAAAITGAARLDPDAFLLVVSSLGPDRDWSVRAALATTLGTLEPDRVRSGVIELTQDPDQRVVGPALTALARVGAPDLDTRLLAALEAPDFVVRATAARLIGGRKIPGAVAALTRAYDRGVSDAAFDARAEALVALAAIGGPEALGVVRRGLSDNAWPLRWRAAELLRAAGEAAEPVRPAPLRDPVEFFESADLLHPPFTPVAFIETRAGTIEIALNVVEAPLTTRSFVALARSGFFNGLRVHRLVPNFVVQAGDPRGDGEGGPGFSIPDELSPLPYVRGTVGMALSWRDTGGSQFFITHSPQPHLDGRYTVFGHVTKGMDVVDQLSLYDVIERIRIWDGVNLK